MLEKSRKRKILLNSLFQRENMSESTSDRQAFDLDVIKDDFEFCREHIRFTIPEIKRITQSVGLDYKIFEFPPKPIVSIIRLFGVSGLRSSGLLLFCLLDDNAS
jgi:hypothetical protein